MNTALILAAVTNPATNAPAAHACNTYGSPNDWFLPSRDELNELFKYWNDNGRPANLILPTNWCWSSSQFNNSNAWSQFFNVGAQVNVGKDNTNSVRAIRAF